MKKNLLPFAALFLMLTACAAPTVPAVPTVPAETSSQSAPAQSPSNTPTITKENVASLTTVASLQPSIGALACSWVQGGESFWLQDSFTVSLVDAATLDQLAKFDGGEYAAIYDTSSDGRFVVYSLDGVEIKLLDILTQKDTLTITPGFQYSNAFFTPGDETLAVTSMENIEIILFSLKDGARVGQLSGFTTAAPVYSASFGSDGDTLIWKSRGTIQPMSIGSGELSPALSHEDFVVAVAGSPDGSLIATTSAGTLNNEFQPLVTLWNAASGEVIWQQGNQEYFSSLDFSPDGGLLAAGTVGKIIIYETSSGIELARLKAGAEPVNSLAFSPDGRVLLTCDTSGIVKLWKVD